MKFQSHHPLFQAASSYLRYCHFSLATVCFWSNWEISSLRYTSFRCCHSYGDGFRQGLIQNQALFHRQRLFLRPWPGLVPWCAERCDDLLATTWHHQVRFRRNLQKFHPACLSDLSKLPRTPNNHRKTTIFETKMLRTPHKI